MAKSPSTKFFTNSDVGAPVLNNQAGSLIALLDACLVTGFNVRSASSATVAAGVMTITYPVSHGYVADKVIKLVGASVAAFNAEYRVMSATATTVSVSVPAAADGAVAGNLETRYAPLGWEKQFSGTNVAVYRRTDLLSTSHVIRIDDTGTVSSGDGGGKNARVRCAASATDVDALVDEWFPSGMATWGKCRNGTCPRWILVGDSRSFWLIPSVDVNYPTGLSALYMFGDIRSFKVGDPNACSLHYGPFTYGADQPGIPRVNDLANSDGRMLAKTIAGVGSYVASALLGTVGSNDLSGRFRYPDAVGALHLWSPVVLELGSTDESHIQRGELAGILASNQKLRSTITDITVMRGSGVAGGADVLLIPVGDSITYQGVVAFDISTPWYA